MRHWLRPVLASVVSMVSACDGSDAGHRGNDEPPGRVPPVAHYAPFVEWEAPGDYSTFRQGAWNGGRGWVFRDLDGDGLRDLVDLASGGVGHGFPDRPHWLFHRNTGAGFAPVAEWPLPPGGEPERGLDEWTSSDPEEGDVWFVDDVTGDRRPDLVFTGRFDIVTRAILGGAADPHWNVHRNTGSGFALEAEAWPIPAAEARVALGWINTQEYDRIISGDYPAGTLTDLDGDGLADIVVTAGEESDDYAGAKRVPGHAEGTPHWLLFRGTGGGFESAAVAWPVPVGLGSAPEGRALGGYADVVGGDRNDLGELWVLRDLDGDARPELVVTGDRDETAPCYVRWSDGQPVWFVYPNTGNGFAGREEWTVPALVGAAWDDGFCRSEKPYDYYGVMAPHWELFDLDADGAPELVQTSEGVSAVGGGLATVALRHEDGRPIWWVHGGRRGGFGRPEAWSVPAEELLGLANDGYTHGHVWMLTDMTGDRFPDLVAIVRDTDGAIRRWRILPFVP